MSLRNNRFLEFYQLQKLNKIYTYEQKEPEYFLDKKIQQEWPNFYNNYINFTDNKQIFSLEPKETEAEDNKFKHYYIKRQKSDLHKENDFLNKKKKRSPKPVQIYKNNIVWQNTGSGIISPKKKFKVEICENVGVNVIQTQKNVELIKPFTQEMPNKSTESTGLSSGQLSKESDHMSVQLEIDTKFISLLEEAYKRPENQNLENEELKRKLKKFLKTKKFGYTSKNNNQNKKEETEVSSWDYFNKLILNIKPPIQLSEGDILIKLFYFIDISKNKEHAVDILLDELNNIKKSNISDIIKNWIRKNFEEDYEEVSKLYKLEKKSTQSKKKVDNSKENNLNFFQSNFESIILEYKKVKKTDEKQKDEENKKEIYDYINKIKNEKDPEDYLIKMTKLDYLSKIKEAKFDEFLEKDKEEQKIKKQRNKCRNKLYELYQAKNLKGLLLLSDQFNNEKKKNSRGFATPKNLKIKLEKLKDMKILN